MLDLDLRRLGHLFATGPRPTRRPFGTPPYVRTEELPALAMSVLSLRIGSFYLCSFDASAAEVLPMAMYLEVRVLPGWVVRVAWIQRTAGQLRELMFPDE
ncbi:MAG TPA: hypothetical protein VHA82_15255 [Ramlibacter sp.]|uniref:hypothetical protein n=1 Tax=Ramlibacter sp. TaxID=1917967 RepID=UPI002C3C0062|nr:hypothetical protein [Ramlibacter sp.]HVZ45167.1 hypothetical protein [Ramlibacter sp.]